MKNSVGKFALKHDVLASLVVFLVALPLCLGVAIASGAPPAAGLISGIIGGIVVGALAGCPLQVSGPAAGLVVIVWQIIANHGMKGLAAALILAGALQALAGFARLGRWFQAVSPAVVQGMLTSIGLLILLSQLQVMFGLSPKGSGIENLRALAGLVGLTSASGGTPNLVAGAIGVGTILVLLVWGKIVPKSLKAVPAQLVGVALITLITAVFALQVDKVSLPANFSDSLSFAGIQTLLFESNASIIIAAVTIAFVASAESLLCSGAVDRMAPHTRTDYDRELVAQGAGNLLCGLVGGLPVTGVIVRSATNVSAGARTRASSMLHGLWLLVFVVLLPNVLELIPIATLAAILVVVGAKLADPKAVVALWRQSRSEVIVFAGTVVAIVTTDLMRGILIGFALSLLRLIVGVARLQTRVEVRPVEQGRVAVLQLEGAATFLGLPRLAAALDAVPRESHLEVDADKLHLIDQACLSLVRSWVTRHEATGGSVKVCWLTLESRLLRLRNGALKAAS